MFTRKYGVVYTPSRLADFTAELLYREVKSSKTEIGSILDPACGECALLQASKNFFGGNVKYYGIDVDKEAILASGKEFEILLNDSILPKNVKKKTAVYWKNKIPTISAIIANPPWSSEKIYNRQDLKDAGFTLISGQYDSFVLFIELAYNILEEGGYFAFIIPDSLFDAQNKNLREFLTKNTEIKVIARLGEKIFDEVNRATTVIVCKKNKPSDESRTRCFRLTTDSRKLFLTTDSSLIDYYDESSHVVLQRRFIDNVSCNFDVDTLADEEELISKIQDEAIKWEEIFNFGRGVEISKAGKVVFCPSCGYAQGYKKSQMIAGEKICTNCGEKVSVTHETAKNVISKAQDQERVQIFVGENIRRYEIAGEYYIQPNITGINYKNLNMYTPPKLLVRKTGLGIYASIDYTGSMTSQTVYILKLKEIKHGVPLEYYLALLNSRVVYYYYLKVYGENEWKSHPYLTKQIIYSLPIRKYVGNKLDKQIIEISTELARKYDYVKDIELEKLIMEKYGLSDMEKDMIYCEMNRLPNLGAVNDMKVEVAADV